jgi:Uma2 family endonuclease
MTALLEPPITRGEIPMPLLRVDLAHYDRMLAAGVFDDQKVELLDGLILEREPMKPVHYTRVKRIYDRLLHQFSGLATVYSEVPIELPHDGRPHPDVLLARVGAGEENYTFPEEVFLLLEVADTSLERDREFKGFLYARDFISEYWILNLRLNQLEVYREPNGEVYAPKLVFPFGVKVACLAFPNLEIDWS